MSEETKTHYRKAFDSPYLSSADIVEPTVLNIKCVRLEADKTKKTKDVFNTAYFVEREIRQGETLKPMILERYQFPHHEDTHRFSVHRRLEQYPRHHLRGQLCPVWQGHG